jgi:hypothetical protein
MKDPSEIVVSPELLAVMTHELEELVEKGATVTLELSPLEAYAALAAIQLACRHPEIDSGAAELAESVGRRIQQTLAPNDPLAAALELAWNKQCQQCGCTNSTPCIDDRGQPCHWAGPSLCSACARPLIFIPGGV